jgi:hypothetical protein
MKLKKILYTVLTAATIWNAPQCYVGALERVTGNCAANAPKIENVEQLREKILDYREILDVDDSAKIEGILHAGRNGAWRLGRKNYLIELNRSDANECSLRHEMYHIADGHLDGAHKITSKIVKKLATWLVYEPQAIIYQTLDLEL